MSKIFDDTRCLLGEGPLWHPGRRELFWFDILKHRLHRRAGGKTHTVQFDEHVSAAGWVSDTELLIASETRLFRFDIEAECADDVVPLEADNAETRSNDGRADPWGGFWIGTMSKTAKRGQGAIYRYYRGEIRQLYGDISISNAICFSPDRGIAYYADSPTRKVMRQRLDAADGWPQGAPEVFLDLESVGLIPDGAVVDAAGNFWNAQWGAWRVACYSPDGRFLKAVGFDAAHTSCPAFGGVNLSDLYCTTAQEDLSDENRAKSDHHGATFVEEDAGRGQPENQVLL